MSVGADNKRRFAKPTVKDTSSTKVCIESIVLRHSFYHKQRALYRPIPIPIPTQRHKDTKTQRQGASGLRAATERGAVAAAIKTIPPLRIPPPCVN